jgi:Zn-dependent peptidase ImmA (M78 family)
MEANLFAAELLMPKTFLAHDLKHGGSFNFPEDKRITELARKYAVSQ